MNREQLEALGFPEAAIVMILDMKAQLIAQAVEIAELKARLNKNSNNSSKPPSSDGLAKPPPKSLRGKSGKKPGGQKGHKGHGLKIDREPDEVIEIAPMACSNCGFDLSNEPLYYAGTRYVYEAKISIELIKYEVMKAVCSLCQTTTAGTPPSEAKGSKSYGNMLRTLCVVLTQYGNMSIDKTRRILRDLFGISLSGGTIKNIMRECAAQTHTSGSIVEIKRNLLDSKTLNLDESGLRVAGKTQWLHVASNSRYTLLHVHRKRGAEGSKAGGVADDYTGTMIHDFWKSYFTFDKCKHAVCCAHLLRELTALVEQNHARAADMIDLLLNMKRIVDRCKSADKTELSRYYHEKFSAQYDAVLLRAKAEIVPSKTKKKSDAENLLIRFEKYRSEIIRFSNDFNVDFDNNQAERDVRPAKVKQKVSGCFRTQSGADNYADTASVIGTIVKHGKSVVGAVGKLFKGICPVVATE